MQGTTRRGRHAPLPERWLQPMLIATTLDAAVVASSAVEDGSTPGGRRLVVTTGCPKCSLLRGNGARLSTDLAPASFGEGKIIKQREDGLLPALRAANFPDGPLQRSLPRLPGPPRTRRRGRRP